MLVSVRSTRFSREHPFGEALGTELVELLLAAGGGDAGSGRRGTRGNIGALRLGVALADLGIAVDDHIADEGQEPRRTVALSGNAEQLRRLVDELGGVVPAHESRVHDELIEKTQIRHHAADAELPERAMHACDGLLRVGDHAVTLTRSES